MNKKNRKPQNTQNRVNKGPNKPSFSKSKNTRSGKEDEELFAEGMSAVTEYLKAAPKKIVYVVSKSSDYDKTERLLETLGLTDVKHHLHDEWFDTDQHMKTPRAPVFAKLNLTPLSEDEFFDHHIENAGSLIVALDHVQDPHNFGAIARSAAYFGVNTLLIPKARQVAFTRASVATSQGAFAYLNVVQVANLKRAIGKLKDEQYWALGADMDGEPVETLKGFYDKTVLVMGNEGKGLSRLISDNCDRIISITREKGELESLNVSVAAGILIQHLAK